MFRKDWPGSAKSGLPRAMDGIADMRSENLPLSPLQFRPWRRRSWDMTFHRVNWKSYSCWFPQNNLIAFVSTRRNEWYIMLPFQVRSRPWHEEKFTGWPFRINLYIIWHFLLRQTRWCTNSFSAIFGTRVMAEKTISVKIGHFDLHDLWKKNG